jgi:hypothetical protein
MCSQRESTDFASHTILNWSDDAPKHATQDAAGSLPCGKSILIHCDQNLRNPSGGLVQDAGRSTLEVRLGPFRADVFVRVLELCARGEAAAFFTLLLVVFSALVLFDALLACLGTSGALEPPVSSISSPNRAATSLSASTFAAEGAAFECDIPSPLPANKSPSSTPRSTHRS